MTRSGGGRAGSTYRAVLSTPGALRFCVAGAVGRMPMAMFGLGSLLLVSGLTGRYGLAGLVSGGGSVCYALCSPQIARLSDRYGQRRVLRPAAAVFAAATTTFVACVELGAPVPAVLAAGCLAGAAMPSLGSMVRARWSALLDGGPALATAYALESVVDEFCFVVGPALVTLLATDVQPAAGVLTAAALCLLGTTALARQVATQPPVAPPVIPEPPAAERPRASADTARPDTAGPDTAGPDTARPDTRGLALRRVAARWRARLPAPVLATLLPVSVFLGAMFATIDLSTVAFAQQHGHKPLAGLILGTYALGSATGGIWYGSRAWRLALERRLVITLVLTVAGVSTFWAMPGLIPLDAVIFVAGLTISPTLIAAFSLVERQAAAGRRTEGLAWLSAAVNVGIAGGSTAAGQVVDAGGARGGYLLAAALGGLAAALCVAGLGRAGSRRGGAAARGAADTTPAGRGVSGAILTQPSGEG